jgi:WD40-like Beta Propeller Repeat
LINTTALAHALAERLARLVPDGYTVSAGGGTVRITDGRYWSETPVAELLNNMREDLLIPRTETGPTWVDRPASPGAFAIPPDVNQSNAEHRTKTATLAVLANVQDLCHSWHRRCLADHTQYCILDAIAPWSCYGSQPTWAPGEGSLTYADVVENFGSIESSKLYTLNLTTPEDEPRPLELGSGIITEPAYSPDGSKLAYVVQQPEKEAELYVANSEGGEAQRIPLPVKNPSQPAFTKDGEHIVFAAVPQVRSSEGIMLSNVYSVNIDPGLELTTVNGDNPEPEYNEQPRPLGNGTVVIEKGEAQILNFLDGIEIRRGKPYLEVIPTGGTGSPKKLPELPGQSELNGLTSGTLGPHAHISIAGAAPDGWCSGHLRGIGEDENPSPSVYESVVDETSNEDRFVHNYKIGIAIERNYDCEEGVSHIYWKASYNTLDLASTSIMLYPAAERYKQAAKEAAVTGQGALTEIQRREFGPLTVYIRRPNNYSSELTNSWFVQPKPAPEIPAFGDLHWA